MQSTIKKHLSLAKVNSTMSIIINNWRMDPSLNALIHCETGETRRLGEYHFILLETLAKKCRCGFIAILFMCRSMEEPHCRR